MKKGFTLIELMVYVAILGVIVIVAGQAFVDSTRFRIRTQSMLKSAEESSRVSALLKEDLAQMGAKSWYDSTGEGEFKTELTEGEWSKVYMDIENGDTSSFAFGTAADSGRYGRFDDIRFNKVKYSAGGQAEAIQQIRWFVNNGVLHRTCTTLDGVAADDCGAENTAAKDVIMADGVIRFSLAPSLPAAPGAGNVSVKAEEILFPVYDETKPSFNFISREEGSITDDNRPFTAKLAIVEQTGLDSSTVVTLRGFKTNYDTTAGIPAASATTSWIAYEVFLADSSKSANWQANCHSFTFRPEETYAVHFNIGFNDNIKDYMRDFQPGIDHLAVGFRKKAGGKRDTIPDFLIYPPQARDDQADTKIRYLEFSVPVAVNDVCLSITAAFFSPRAHRGEIKIENFKVVRKLDEVYHFTEESDFDYTSNDYVNDNGFYTEEDDFYNPETPEEKQNVKAFKLYLDIAKRGEVGRSVLVIPTPNNGIQEAPAPAAP
ncbi:MAG: type II secretion system GspH family protein [Fibrobacter sp.]|jgi:prepilin-type N-terminal cleavage/methylation domain-containing protein|nr:type II secretion system GspH family protein [Fibrobacter sp.]